MRERVNARNGKRKIGVVFEGQRQAHGFDGERNVGESPSKGSVSGVVSSEASLSGVRMGSKTLAVWRPLPMSFTPSPMGMVTMTCTGSGNSGPRRILFGFNSSSFTRQQPLQQILAVGFIPFRRGRHGKTRQTMVPGERRRKRLDVVSQAIGQAGLAEHVGDGLCPGVSLERIRQHHGSASMYANSNREPRVVNSVIGLCTLTQVIGTKLRLHTRSGGLIKAAPGRGRISGVVLELNRRLCNWSDCSLQPAGRDSTRRSWSRGTDIAPDTCGLRRNSNRSGLG